MVPEDPTRDGLVPVLSVAMNMTLVDLKAVSRRGVLSLRREREVAGRFVRELSISTSSVHTAVSNLSGGNQQKVLLAKALSSRADMGLASIGKNGSSTTPRRLARAVSRAKIVGRVATSAA